MITCCEYDCYVKIIAHNVKVGREKLGICKSELARRINMSPNTISKIEAGTFGMPSVVTCSRLSKLFEISVENLIGEE